MKIPASFGRFVDEMYGTGIGYCADPAAVVPATTNQYPPLSLPSLPLTSGLYTFFLPSCDSATSSFVLYALH